MPSSFARLIHKEFGSEQVMEGYFAPQADRQSYVRLEKERAYLVLVTMGASSQGDEVSTDLPAAHAKGLLEVCPATLILERSTVLLPGHTAIVDRVISPGPLDVVSVEFTSQEDAAGFLSPLWFGAEVTQNDGFLNPIIAMSGVPSPIESEASNAGLEALLDHIEVGKFGRAMQPIADTHGELAPLPHRSATSLPVISAAELSSERTTVDVERGPLVLQTIPREPESEGDRLANVIEGLSAALTTATPSDHVDAARPRRWSRGTTG